MKCFKCVRGKIIRDKRRRRMRKVERKNVKRKMIQGGESREDLVEGDGGMRNKGETEGKLLCREGSNAEGGRKGEREKERIYV